MTETSTIVTLLMTYAQALREYLRSISHEDGSYEAQVAAAIAIVAAFDAQAERIAELEAAGSKFRDAHAVSPVGEPEFVVDPQDVHDFDVALREGEL